MSDRPTGTVTFLFSDIEGSTRLLQALGAEQYESALTDHRRLMREALWRHGGHEVDTQGDAFFVAFGRAQDALNAALEMQGALVGHTWPEGRAMRARMGIHTGEAIATDEGYVGTAVHRGARICGSAHGGQILVSDTTRALAEDGAASFSFRDLGEHRLKDMTQPQRLFQVLGPGLSQDFPPIKTLENRPTNLPVQTTPLIGRDGEVAQVVELMQRADTRMVTLTGPGGTGKTRLALQAAAELVEDFPNGVFFVAMAAIGDPALAMPTVAQTIGVNEAAGQDLAAYLAGKQMLLVADNLEQVIDAGPSLAELLAGAPDVKLLVTSREALRLAAERVYPVPPLTLPDLAHLPEPQNLTQYKAVALFLERAQAARPDFAVTVANAPAVAEICVRLDGLPLAIELAAARIPLLSPEAMLRRLGERLKLLRGGARDLPARQQTLRDTLLWSYDLLTDEERTLFACLGVFAGGFTLEAAEAICAAELDTLESLVAKSLIRRNGERLEMLETIRELAVERLAASGEEHLIRERHAAHFMESAEQAYLERVERETERSEELEIEHDNVRAALDWLGQHNPRGRLSLAGAMGWFWTVHSHLQEGRARLAESLASTSGRDAIRARAFASAGKLAAWQGDITEAKRLVEEAISIWHELGVEQEVAFALYDLGWGNFFVGDDSAARDCFEESLRLQRAIGRPFLINRAQMGLFQVLVALHDVETVEREAPAGLQLSLQLGDRRSVHYIHHFLGDCALIRGDAEQAEPHYHRALVSAVELGDRSESAYEIQGLAMSAAGTSRWHRALRVGGAADAELTRLGVDYSGVRFWNELLDRYLGMAREQLGEEAANRMWEEGSRVGFDAAVQEALTVDRATDVRSPDYLGE